MNEAQTPQLAIAYAFCRSVAKREAKNFYWAFLALPRAKSDAMCAVYAFMRKADDLSDDETMPLEARREAMRAWTAAWRSSRALTTGDPVFLAVNDAQRRFGISDELLEQLVAGTTMDLQPELPGMQWVSGDGTGGYQVYKSFDDLYRYCYLVASVVGLVTIRIFGYQDPLAEQLAEHTGVAFQLTNILRDVREDAERGRIYLPLSDMERNGGSVSQLLTDLRTGSASPAVEALLQQEIARSQEFYKDGHQLIPLIARDAQPAMRVLVRIYERLLQRIASNPAAVLRQRISVSNLEKLTILGRGLIGSLLARSRA